MKCESSWIAPDINLHIYSGSLMRGWGTECALHMVATCTVHSLHAIGVV